MGNRVQLIQGSDMRHEDDQITTDTYTTGGSRRDWSILVGGTGDRVLHRNQMAYIQV